jgi:hypothetical protein
MKKKNGNGNGKKGVKRHNFISFYTVSSLSLPQKWVPPHPFTNNFPENPYPSPPKILSKS